MKYQTQIFSFWILVFVSFSSFSFANKALVPDVLVLESTENFGIVYTHSLQKNQTIYGLAKFFNTQLENISAANPGVKLNEVKLNQSVKVPINTKMITPVKKDKYSTHYIPVFYTVKAKDNLFRIAKIYFNQKIETVMKINNLQSMDLNVGQKILVGWYEYDPAYENKVAWNIKGIEVNTSNEISSYNSTPNYVTVQEKRKIAHEAPDKSKPVFQKVISSRDVVPPIKEEKVLKNDHAEVVNSAIVKEQEPSTDPIANADDEGDSAVDGKVEVTDVEVDNETVEKVLSSDPFENRNGIYNGEYEEKPVIHKKKIRAQWNSKSKDKVNLFALHSTAKTNSYIEIYNPMQDRMVIAKVVGNIPAKIHKKNVDLIVSPKVAETLGVVDKKFFVTIKYIE